MSAVLSDITNLVESTGKSVVVNGVIGGAKALLLARLVRLNPARTILVIVPDGQRARSLLDDCTVFFSPTDANRLTIFPESSTLPFLHISPEPDDWADRISVLHRLLHREPLVVIAPVGAVMRRVPPREFISSGEREIRTGERIDVPDLLRHFVCYGYEDVGLVEDEGTFARRGGIVDLWPPTIDKPVRVELDGDRIASMRSFDPATQRSKTELKCFTLIPVRDIPLDEPGRSRAVLSIKGRADDMGLTPRERRGLIQQIQEGIAFPGIETLLPLFHETTATIFNYVSPDSIVIIEDETDVESAAASHIAEVVRLASETTSPERIVHPEEIILPGTMLREELLKFKTVRLNALTAEGGAAPEEVANAGVTGNEELRHLVVAHPKNEDMLTPLITRLKSMQSEGMRIVFTSHNQLQAGRLSDLFRPHGILLEMFDAPFEAILDMTPATIHARLGRLSKGFCWPSERLVVISDEEIFGGKVARRTPPSPPMEPFASLGELAEGDYIVHEKHGIGRFRALAHLTIEDKPGDYLVIEYLGGDKLYLPVYRLNLVGKYIGAGEAPPLLDRLGGMHWMQVKMRVNRAIRTMARDLLQIYASREVFPGFPFPDAGLPYEEFSAAFPYDETPDQTRAIDDVMRDMSIERPMDRLICGDVGYGKTEVAMRAALRAAMSGKQVAVLVPTTVLALQHYETFSRRFANTPVVTTMFSRFRKAAEQKTVIESLRRGTADIVIGTHRLLQKDVSFKNLGLLIIDEEHRFGVRHKERIKKMKTTVDVITLTATPIPRTLNLSLSGIRDISIINTPPADRLSISTYVVPWDDVIIRQAMLHELKRGGQVFFVHNRVETIGSMHQMLKQLVPEARTTIGHGQLKESELERVMIDFIERKADVLLCTTIIESGLDMPNVNTIIVNRADTFGLAQLYQLRGRVGRSNIKAFAYLLTPHDGEMTVMAKKRLTVLKRFTELGSGFQIAMHDLEFRGAGNMLGSSQSGHVAAVGYEMYTRLLNREVRKLTGKTAAEGEEIDPELNLKVAAFLPEAYVADVGMRIDLYRRLASRESAEEIAALEAEITDRFGPMPAEAKNLIGVMETKVLARSLRIKQITFDGATFSCQLDQITPFQIESLIGLISNEPDCFRLMPPDRLLVSASGAKGDDEILAAIKNSLRRLTGCVSDLTSNRPL